MDEKFHGARHWAKLAFPIWGFEWCTLIHFWGDVSCVRWKTYRRFCTPPWKILQMEFSMFRCFAHPKPQKKTCGSLAPQIHTINSLFQLLPKTPKMPHTSPEGTSARSVSTFFFWNLSVGAVVDVWFHVIKRRVFAGYFRNLFRVALLILKSCGGTFSSSGFKLNNKVLFQYVYLQAGAMAPLSLMWWYLNPLIRIKPGTFSTNMLLATTLRLFVYLRNQNPLVVCPKSSILPVVWC